MRQHTTEAMADETTTTAAMADETTTTEAMADGVACDEPVKVGVITDQTGALAIYGAHIMASFPLGMEYATGAAGVRRHLHARRLPDRGHLQGRPERPRGVGHAGS